MSDETAFLNAILANPKDDAPRLVYADWLDERGDERAAQKAEFLRITCRLMTVPAGPRHSLFVARLREKAAGLDLEWLAVVSKLQLEACVSLFEFQCPRRWENLSATDDVTVRWCAVCQSSVHFCAAIDEARDHARRGRCVAVNLTVVRAPGDLNGPGRRFTPEEIRTLGRVVVGRIAQVEPAGTAEERRRPEPPSRRERRERRRRKRFDAAE